VCGRSRVQVPGWPNLTHRCCKRFVTTSTSTSSSCVTLALCRRDGYRKLVTRFVVILQVK